jgi:hypothetical protein
MTKNDNKSKNYESLDLFTNTISSHEHDNFDLHSCGDIMAEVDDSVCNTDSKYDETMKNINLPTLNSNSRSNVTTFKRLQEEVKTIGAVKLEAKRVKSIKSYLKTLQVKRSWKNEILSFLMNNIVYPNDDALEKRTVEILESKIALGKFRAESNGPKMYHIQQYLISVSKNEDADFFREWRKTHVGDNIYNQLSHSYKPKYDAFMCKVNTKLLKPDIKLVIIVSLIKMTPSWCNISTILDLTMGAIGKT